MSIPERCPLSRPSRPYLEIASRLRPAESRAIGSVAHRRRRTGRPRHRQDGQRQDIGILTSPDRRVHNVEEERVDTGRASDRDHHGAHARAGASDPRRIRQVRQVRRLSRRRRLRRGLEGRTGPSVAGGVRAHRRHAGTDQGRHRHARGRPRCRLRRLGNEPACSGRGRSHARHGLRGRHTRHRVALLRGSSSSDVIVLGDVAPGRAGRCERSPRESHQGDGRRGRTEAHGEQKRYSEGTRHRSLATHAEIRRADAAICKRRGGCGEASDRFCEYEIHGEETYRVLSKQGHVRRADERRPLAEPTRGDGA
mmetsp:Transcript_27554/g.66300  ORF Transcript_27554/g.66300 Transcript_27554/m.66300 type:complete len:310 (-) Transcript_27554:584-1513(-)